MKRMFLGLVTLIIMLSLNGCSEKKNLEGLISQFQEEGISGDFETLAFAMIGAIDGGRIEGKNFSIEVYEWKDSSDVSKITPYKNGRFGLLIHFPNPSSNLYKKIVDIFENY